MSKVSIILSNKFAAEEAAIAADYKKAVKALDEAKDAKMKALTGKKDNMLGDLEKVADRLYEKRDENANVKSFVTSVHFLSEAFESPILEDRVNGFIFGGSVGQRKFSDEKSAEIRKFIEFHHETIGKDDSNQELFELVLVLLVKKILPNFNENLSTVGTKSWADMGDESYVPPMQSHDRASSDVQSEQKYETVQPSRASTDNSWATVVNSRRVSPINRQRNGSLNDLEFMLRDTNEQRNQAVENLIDSVNSRYDQYAASDAFSPKSGKIHPYTWLKALKFMNTGDVETDVNKVFPIFGTFQYDLDRFVYEKNGVKIVYAVPTSGFMKGRMTWHDHPDISSKDSANADSIIWKRFTTDALFFMLKLNSTKGTIEAYKYVPLAGEYKGVKNTAPEMIDNKYIDETTTYTEDGVVKPYFTKISYEAALKLTKY